MIKVKVIVDRPIENVWNKWTNPEDVMLWNFASDDWYCPKATNNLVDGGTFNYTMSSKDGKNSFDFEGEYLTVKQYQLIEYRIKGGRRVAVLFKKISENKTKIVEMFEPENENSEAKQEEGWQSILNSFKKYCESN